MKAVLGIGTNVGERINNIENALSALGLLPTTTLIGTSGIYETEPWGYLQQEKFLNCAVLVETLLSPNALLGACLGIEAGLGRIRKFKNGPRIIDIDVLLYEDTIINSQELTIPHPLIRQRDFVLVPLNDLFPDKIAFGFDFSDAFDKVDLSKLTKIR